MPVLPDGIDWVGAVVPADDRHIAVGDTLVMVGSKGSYRGLKDRCVAAAWRSGDGGPTWGRTPDLHGGRR